MNANPDAASRSTDTQLAFVRPRLLLFALCAFLLATCTRTAPVDWWDTAHLATAEAIAEHGTLAIDGTAHEHTAQRVVVEHGATTRTFAVTPPLPSLLAAAVLGLGGGYRAATLLVCGLPFLLALLALERLLARSDTVSSGRTLVLVAVALATPALGYATALNGVPLALLGLALGALALVDGRSWIGGLALGVAIASVPAAAALAVFLVPLGPRRLAVFLLGAALPLGLSIGALAGAGAAPLGWPAAAWEYALSFARLHELVPHDPFDSGPLDAWIGPRGVLARAPALLLGAFGLVHGLRRRSPLARRLGFGALALAIVGSLPVVLPWGLVPAAHVLLVVPLAWGAAQLDLRHVPSTTGLVAGLALLSVPGAVFALRSPLFVWHLVPHTTPSAQLGAPTGDLVAHWSEQWERASLPRPATRERLAGEFEVRLQQLTHALVDDPRARRRDLQRLERGLARIAADLDARTSPLYTRPLAHYLLGRAREALGQLGAAEAAYRACVRLYPSFDAARARIAALRRSAAE